MSTSRILLIVRSKEKTRAKSKEKTCKEKTPKEKTREARPFVTRTPNYLSRTPNYLSRTPNFHHVRALKVQG